MWRVWKGPGLRTRDDDGRDMIVIVDGGKGLVGGKERRRRRKRDWELVGRGALEGWFRWWGCRGVWLLGPWFVSDFAYGL